MVLSRGRDEEIVIGEGADQIVIKIVDVRGEKVRLGIDAPRQIRVDRREVRDQIERERAAGTRQEPSASH